MHDVACKFRAITLRIPMRIISHVISARALENGGFSILLDLAIEVNRHFFENDCGNL